MGSHNEHPKTKYLSIGSDIYSLRIENSEQMETGKYYIYLEVTFDKAEIVTIIKKGANNTGNMLLEWDPLMQT